MAATKYIVTVVTAEGETTLDKQFVKKATAVDAARVVRKEQLAGVRVATTAGTVVFEQPAPKKIKMSPRYTRVMPLPEGVTAPEGMRVAYVYNRRGGAILHDGATYRIMLTKGDKAGTVLEDEFETTRAAGDAMRAIKVELANA